MRRLEVWVSTLDPRGERWSPRRRWLALQLALGAGLLAVFARYFSSYRLTTPSGKIWGVADDVYVSACFARTLSEGDGLLWYPGAPRVEGFSSPLWVMLLAALHRLPGFRENLLGIYVAACNAVVMALVGVVLARCARRTAGPPAKTTRRRSRLEPSASSSA